MIPGAIYRTIGDNSTGNYASRWGAASLSDNVEIITQIQNAVDPR